MAVAEGIAELTFWGTRGSISTPGRSTEKYGGNTPCVSVELGDSLIIFDAGTGIRNLGISLAKSQKQYNELHILLSHTHWDHIQGLPFFVPSYLKGTKINVYGNPNKGGFLKSILEGQMESDYFPINMSSLGADFNVVELQDEAIQFGPFTMQWQEQVYHPGGCLRYKLTFGDKSIVYATDVEINKMFKALRNDAHKEEAQKYMEFIANADVLIADGQYTDEEYGEKIDWGHSSMELVMQVAHQAAIDRLVLFHHDPDRTDKMLDALSARHRPTYQAMEPARTVMWGREGMTLPV